MVQKKISGTPEFSLSLACVWCTLEREEEKMFGFPTWDKEESSSELERAVDNG